MYLPCRAALYALMHMRTLEDESCLYYSGPFSNDKSPEGA